jgi:hypothetical protein
MQTTTGSRFSLQPRRRTALLALAGALACAGLTCARAYAREDAPPHAYNVWLRLAVHGQTSSPVLTVEEDKPFAVAVDSGGKPWRAEFVLKHTGEPDRVRMSGKIVERGTTLTEPVVVGKLGERMAIQVGDDVKLAIVVQDHAP